MDMITAKKGTLLNSRGGGKFHLGNFHSISHSIQSKQRI